MFCKRLQATMTVNTCQKRQKKAQSYMEYEACRSCPQSQQVNSGQETDQDIVRIIREISMQSPLGVQHQMEIRGLDSPDQTPPQVLTTQEEKYDRRRLGRKRSKARFSESAPF